MTTWKLIGTVKPVCATGEGVCPRVAMLHDRRHRKIDTEGDGACAIHSVFGAPTADKAKRLFVADARERAAKTLGATALEFRDRLRAPHLYDSTCAALWRDLLLPVLYRECGRETGLQVRTQGLILWSWA